MSQYLILGAGLAGLSTAYHLKGLDYTLFEADNRIGGLCKTEVVDGFTFDYTGHFLHFKNERVKKLVLELMGESIVSHTRKSGIFLYDVVTPYPFQLNTFGHSAEVRKECLLGLIKAKYEATNTQEEVKNFQDWILKTCGEGVAKHFMFPYNKKIWTVEPKEMTVDWLSGYIPVPDIAASLDGALRAPSETIGYNASFYYPAVGGIEALPKAFSPYINNLRLQSKAEWINLRNQTICVNNQEYNFDKLISTLPLNKLISLIKDVDDEIGKLSRELRHNSVLTVNVGVKKENISDYHWLYFPEEKYIFYRVGFPSQISASMAPLGTSSLSVEISYTPTRPIDPKVGVSRVIEDLKLAKILEDTDEILTTSTMNIPCAYVIYDQKRTEILSHIKAYLKRYNIHTIGRYGNWEYSAMEDAIFQGMQIADEIKGEK